ncbi:YolD-like family protein [Sutcliffiella cohnii]|uniref:YolD-like family protein n=1 Tax=Sutcliffiella cohnii TaxID=33932 RepID=A0A223KPX5_9BACI|nr:MULTISPECIES: YolD-like family protein [Sutcliffiella]AST91456.1 hypothetical protein BC6307_09270 [Sutcliffiella cohnii]MED4014982.1 YolD-like family protein [Sutcliffiella cohnii]WBL17284.1 YolD-like family protein [Sutcliffiella sp. NC1]
MEHKRSNKIVSQSMFLWKNEHNRTVQAFLVFPDDVPDFQYIQDLLHSIYLNKETVRLTAWFEGEIIQITGKIHSFRFSTHRITVKDIDKNKYHLRLVDIVEIVRKLGK